MKKFFSLLAAMSIILSTRAQTGGNITGSVRFGGNQPIIAAATVSLLKAIDSAMVKATVADAAGNFNFEKVKEGKYLVLASSVGHLGSYSQIITVSAVSPDARAGVLQLVPIGKDLKEVKVNSKKPFIERKADKTIVNVDASITSVGSTALEVLEKSPGVTVDKDGNVSLKGKQGVMIMMDGKPTYLSGPELTNMLRNMSAANIDQVEIMTNPSAKYDAAGKSGIINIRTKKNKQKGFNGSTTLGYGQGAYPKSNNSLNLNYRTGKFNIFGSFSANYRKNFQHLYILRHYRNNDKTLKAIFEQNSDIINENHNYTAKAGADLYLNKRTTLGIVFSGISSPENVNGFNTSYLKNNTGTVDSIVTASNRENSTWKNGSINLNMRHQFDSTGREITGDLDYIYYRSNKYQQFINTSYTPLWSPKSGDELVGALPTQISIYSAKLDYTHPLKSGTKIESGLKSSYVETENTAGYFNVINGVKFTDFEKTNRFNYMENINAAYVNLSRELKKWNLQAGLRLENTNYQGHQFGNPQKADSSFKKSYTNLFPTLFVGYNPSEKSQFSFSYGLRINRPNYEDLNPFLFFLDKYTYAAGNPFLRPQYSNVFELNHTFRQFLTTTLNFSHTKDLFNETFEEKGFATVVRQDNYGFMDDASLSVSAEVPVAKWFSSNIYTQAKYNRFKGILYSEDLDVHATTFLVNVSNQFKFTKGWSAELSGFYRTRGIEGQIQIRAMGQLSAGLQKQVLKSKGTLKLNMRDIFNTQRPVGNINFQNTEAYFKETHDNRVASISFSYRFGKPVKGLQQRKTGGAGDEQNRVKGVGN